MTKKPSLWQRIKNAFSPSQSTTAHNDENPSTEDLTGQVIVDLTQPVTPNESPTSLKITAEAINVMLVSMGYHFTYHPPKAIGDHDNNPSSLIHHFSMQVSDGDRDWGCLLRYFETEQLLAVYSIFPFTVPESHLGEMLSVMAYLNYDLVLGNLELDIHDGEMRFKTSLDLEVAGLSEMVLAYLLQSNFSVTSRLFDTLSEVVAKTTPATTANEAVDNLLANQQANTFYLMTEVLQ